MDGERYQAHDVYYRQDDISVLHGTDPLNGLPVLIYQFPGEPATALDDLESEHIPGVLATSFDGERGRLVTVHMPRYDMVAPGEDVVDDDFALAAALAAADAERAGIVHGDLRPGRIFYDRGHLLIEGYGVPWRASVAGLTAPEVLDGAPPSAASDVYALAATLAAMGAGSFSDGVEAVLAAAREPDAGARPSAVELLRSLQRAIDDASRSQARAGAVTPPSRSFNELTLPTMGAHDAHPLGSSPNPRDASESASSPQTRLSSANPSVTHVELETDLALLGSDSAESTSGTGSDPLAPTPGDTPDPITVVSDPGLQLPPGGGIPSSADAGQGFVRDLPPGATYRAGNLDTAPTAAPIRVDLLDEVRPARRSWRAPLLFLLLLVVAGGLAALVFVNRSAPLPTPATRDAVNYLVDVRVSPTGLPPVTLVVLSSPAGSALTAGTILGNAPRKVLLDRAGVWVLQAQFQDRRSEPANLLLPDDRDVTVTFPEPPPDRTDR